MDVRSLLYTKEQALCEKNYPIVTQYGHEKRNLHWFEIDGDKISGYYTYTFFYQKTYAKEPERSQGGVIDNLNSYATFNTPTLKIKFNALSIDQYRKIMQHLLAKNEFVVTCYDPIYDRYLTAKMYFAPSDYPELFSLDFQLLAVLNYEVELIGTNADFDTTSVVYHLVNAADPNAPQVSDKTYTNNDVPVGMEFIAGDGADSVKTLAGYTFDKWATADGTVYLDGNPYYLVNNSGIVLYAQWKPSTTYTLSYNYGNGESAIDSSNLPITQKDINYRSAITFTSTKPKKVSWNNTLYDAYNETSWWTLTVQPNGTHLVNGSTPYQIKGNATIYQHFSAKTFAITYEVDGATYSTIQGEYNAVFVKPTPPTKAGKTFSGWYLKGSNTEFTQNTIPPTNITVSAKFK